MAPELGWQRPQIASPSPALTMVAFPRARFSPIWPMFNAKRSERLLPSPSTKAPTCSPEIVLLV